MTTSKPRLDAAIDAAAIVFTLFGANGHSWRTGPDMKGDKGVSNPPPETI